MTDYTERFRTLSLPQMQQVLATLASRVRSLLLDRDDVDARDFDAALDAALQPDTRTWDQQYAGKSEAHEAPADDGPLVACGTFLREREALLSEELPGVYSPSELAAREAPQPNDAGVIRAAEGVVLGPGEYEVEAGGARISLGWRVPVTRKGYAGTLHWGIGSMSLTAVRRVEPEQGERSIVVGSKWRRNIDEVEFRVDAVSEGVADVTNLRNGFRGHRTMEHIRDGYTWVSDSPGFQHWSSVANEPASTGTTLNDFHRMNAARQHEAFAPAHSLMALVVCVQEEVGELAAAVLGVSGEKKRKAHLTSADVLDAVADAMTYLSLVASNVGCTDLEALLGNVFNMVSERCGSKLRTGLGQKPLVVGSTWRDRKSGQTFEVDGFDERGWIRVSPATEQQDLRAAIVNPLHWNELYECVDPAPKAEPSAPGCQPGDCHEYQTELIAARDSALSRVAELEAKLTKLKSLPPEVLARRDELCAEIYGQSVDETVRQRDEALDRVTKLEAENAGLRKHLDYLLAPADKSPCNTCGGKGVAQHRGFTTPCEQCTNRTIAKLRSEYTVALERLARIRYHATFPDAPPDAPPSPGEAPSDG